MVEITSVWMSWQQGSPVVSLEAKMTKGGNDIAQSDLKSYRPLCEALEAYYTEMAKLIEGDADRA